MATALLQEVPSIYTAYKSDIITKSLRGKIGLQTLEVTSNNANGRGIIVVAAVGNRETKNLDIKK